MIEKEIWTLPRPRKPYYPGGFPRHFEIKLIQDLGNPNKILHPFGGMAEYGTRIDINEAVKPNVIADAGKLPFAENSFDLIICDPPYNDKLSQELYGVKQISTAYIKESVRVCKRGGFIALYHWHWVVKPKDTEYHKIIVVLLGQNHRPRICCIYRKRSCDD